MNELINSLLDQVEYSSKIDGLNSESKSELLMIQKNIVKSVKELKVQAKNVSDDDVDKLGLVFSEKLINILRK